MSFQPTNTGQFPQGIYRGQQDTRFSEEASNQFRAVGESLQTLEFISVPGVVIGGRIFVPPECSQMSVEIMPPQQAGNVNTRPVYNPIVVSRPSLLPTRLVQSIQEPQKKKARTETVVMKKNSYRLQELVEDLNKKLVSFKSINQPLLELFKERTNQRLLEYSGYIEAGLPPRSYLVFDFYYFAISRLSPEELDNPLTSVLKTLSKKSNQFIDETLQALISSRHKELETPFPLASKDITTKNICSVISCRSQSLLPKVLPGFLKKLNLDKPTTNHGLFHLLHLLARARSSEEPVSLLDFQSFTEEGLAETASKMFKSKS